MKESCWRECMESDSSIRISPDPAKSRSLHETAKGRVLYLKGTAITPENVNFIFEGYYSSVLEILHSIASKDGYKIRNHICIGYFIRDVLKREDLFRLFDDCRYKRNSIVYYGKQMDFATAKSAIGGSEKLIKELSRILKGNL